MWVVGALVGGVLVGMLLGMVPLLWCRRLRAQTRRALGDGRPETDGADASVTAEEVALLAGGPERAAQVALASLFLDGSVRGTPGGLRAIDGTSTPGSELPELPELRGVLLRLLREDGIVRVRHLVAAAAASPDVRSLLDRLARRGLCRDTAAVRDLQARWGAAHAAGSVGAVVGFLAVCAGSVLLPWLLPWVATAFLGAALAVGWGTWLVAGTSLEEGLSGLTPRTAAGDAAVAAAAAAHAAQWCGGGCDWLVPLPHALRDLALSGFGGLCPPLFRHPPRREEGITLQHAPTSTGEVEYVVDLRRFAEWCAVRAVHERRDAPDDVALARPALQTLWNVGTVTGASGRGSAGNWQLTVHQSSDRQWTVGG